MSIRLLTSIVCVLLTTACGGAHVSSPADSLGAEPTESHRAVALDCSDDRYLGPWTACPEAEWVRGIAESAGYEIGGDTGSALIARGDGYNFYLWATRGSGSLGGLEGESPRCRIGDVNVWAGRSGMTDWRYWHAQGFTFWISAGPLSTSRSPDPCDLDDLVHASQVQTPPHSE